MQFSAKIFPNNSFFGPNLGFGVPHLGIPGSATVYGQYLFVRSFFEYCLPGQFFHETDLTFCKFCDYSFLCLVRGIIEKRYDELCRRFQSGDPESVAQMYTHNCQLLTYGEPPIYGRKGTVNSDSTCWRWAGNGTRIRLPGKIHHWSRKVKIKNQMKLNQTIYYVNMDDLGRPSETIQNLILMHKLIRIHSVFLLTWDWKGEGSVNLLLTFSITMENNWLIIEQIHNW